MASPLHKDQEPRRPDRTERLFLRTVSGNEDFICPIIIVELHVKNLRRFQIQPLNRSSFLFKACLEKDLGPKEREEVFRDIRMKLQEILSQKEMDNVTFDIEEVDDLQVDPKTGKFRLITN